MLFFEQEKGLSEDQNDMNETTSSTDAMGESEKSQ